jgi:phage tail sheath gpL-like
VPETVIVPAAGTVHLRIGGDVVDVAVASGEAANTIATAIGAAINAATDLPVTASVNPSTPVVTLTARNDGVAGNEIDVRYNYQWGEELPAGVTLAIVAMASGAQNPVLTSVIAAMGDTWFNVIAHPWTDATSLAALEAELSSRFGPLRMIDGWALCGSSAAYGTVSSLGDSRNSPHSSILRTGGMPSLPYEVAAAVAGVTALAAQADPARPFQTLAAPGALAPAEADRDTILERNLLLYDGVSTLAIGAGDVVQIERLITTYKTSAAGSPDTAYLDVTTMLTLMYLRYSFRARMLSRYPRHKLAADGTRFGSGQAVVTPKLAKAEAIAWFRQMEDLGLVEGFDQFKRDLVVERNALDPNRLDILIPPDLINQLIVTAAKIGFLL